MNTIRKRLAFLAVSSLVCLLLPAMPFFKYTRIYMVYGSSFVDFSYTVSALILILFLFEFNRLSFASLITENSIIHIRSTETVHSSEKKSGTVIITEATDIFVSCFGILLGSRIIKFNTKGIQLKKVEIDPDFINICYGKGARNDSIRLLHSTLNELELMDILEKFRHETGIDPVVME